MRCGYLHHTAEGHISMDTQLLDDRSHLFQMANGLGMLSPCHRLEPLFRLTVSISFTLDNLCIGLEAVTHLIFL